ncbi:uncharacterized protein LOC132748925 [Ruditapes philippinarum]|uniref:uncharacterized protein LOC132748925 n=1 Tax=Ruditapes philippinarum TaxID=129788 RepID=UPI00295AFDC8|nr:uncharacterized protein LOC132748925 [Ruditapes philippinarum]
MVEKCKNVITSTTQVQFSKLGRVYCSQELLPLNETDARQLLKNVTEEIDLGDYESAMITLSEGLPLLILMIGSELTEDAGMITPKNMVDLLLTCRLKALSREFYPEEDRVGDVYRKFLDRLDEVYKNHLTVLDYIPGTFSAKQAQLILDINTVEMTMEETLLPARRRNILHYDLQTKRFGIQGILRECIKSFYIIKNLPEVRRRYIQIFSAVMINISKRLNTSDYTNAMAEYFIEQPNLQKLLIEVENTAEDNYKFFIEMVINCTKIIEQFMSGNGQVFYEHCLQAAERYGKDEDKAAINIAVGSLYTNITGNLLGGKSHYKAALDILEHRGERSLLLATTYQRIGWNTHLQGKNTNAIRYFKKSLAITMISGEKFKVIAVQSLNSMGVSYTFLGKFKKAEKYHFQSLKRCRMFLGESHPGIAACYNNIGEMYDLKGDTEKAMEYYKRGLDMKLQCNAPVLSTVLSLCSTAKMMISLSQFKEAHSLLDDGNEKLKKEKLPPKEAEACICHTKGLVYKEEGRYKDAKEMFRKAVDIRQNIAPNNIQYIESLSHLADIYKIQGYLPSSLKYCEKVLQLKEQVITSTPHTLVIADTFDRMADMYKKQDNTHRYVDTLEELESELLRLERVFLSHQNDRDLYKIRNRLRDLDACFKVVHCGIYTRE